MIRIKDLKNKYPNFRTLMRRHFRKDIEEALNFYQDNQNVKPEDITENFECFSYLEAEIMLECFKKED